MKKRFIYFYDDKYDSVLLILKYILGDKRCHG